MMAVISHSLDARRPRRNLGISSRAMSQQFGEQRGTTFL
jgi:hypothetical protein